MKSEISKNRKDAIQKNWCGTSTTFPHMTARFGMTSDSDEGEAVGGCYVINSHRQVRPIPNTLQSRQTTTHYLHQVNKTEPTVR